MKHAAYKSRSWNLPVWFIAGIMTCTCIQHFFIYKEWTQPKTNEFYFFLMGWPSLLLGEAIIYWVIRRKIRERKWIWLHLLFSLIAFVILGIGFVLVYNMVYPSIRDPEYAVDFLVANVRFYSFWFTFVIAHIFFIIVIVRSFGKRTPMPDDHDDFLSELPG